MTLDTLDYQIHAARVGRKALESMLGTLRAWIVNQWLMENRGHAKYREVDRLLTSYRAGKNPDALDQAELVIDRYAQE